MYTVVWFEKTCDACPSQWEGKTSSGESFYARYRFGQFTLAIDGVTVIRENLGDDLAGFMTDDAMRILTRGFLIFP